MRAKSHPCENDKRPQIEDKPYAISRSSSCNKLHTHLSLHYSMQKIEPQFQVLNQIKSVDDFQQEKFQEREHHKIWGVRHSYSNKHLLMTKDRNWPFEEFRAKRSRQQLLDNPMEEETVKSLEKLKQLITETQDEVMNHVKNGVITVGDINYTTDLNTKVSTFTKELKSFLISIEEICRKHYQIN